MFRESNFDDCGRYATVRSVAMAMRASGCMGTNNKQHLSNICSEVLTNDPALVSRLEYPAFFPHSPERMFRDIVNMSNVLLTNSHKWFVSNHASDKLNIVLSSKK